MTVLFYFMPTSILCRQYHICIKHGEQMEFKMVYRASSTALANSPKFLYLHVANASFPARVFGTPSPSRQVKASGRSIHTEDKPSTRAGTWSCGSDCATTRICSGSSDGSSAC